MADRTLEYDLKFLIAVLNWAARSRDERGRLLLDSNPLKGLRTPAEKNPTRVVIADETYRALLKVSPRVDWRFHVALVLAHETGHRIGAIQKLRWCDIDFEGGMILLRAEHDKSGYEHVTPVTPEALSALREAPLGPERSGAARAQESRGGCGRRSVARREGASTPSLKVLCELGVWKTAKTVLQCYQRPDA